MNKSKLIRVLLADNYPVVLEGLAAMIEREPDMTVVGKARDGYEVTKVFHQQQPDIVLMDLRLPKLSGMAVIKTICAEFERASTIIFTTYDGDEDIYCGIQAGAKGYLFKNAEPDELLEAIRTVAGGDKYISPAVAAKLEQRMCYPELSDRELEVLRLVANGMSNQQIGEALLITEGTVKYHVNNILAKLTVRDRTQATLVALRRGIVQL